MIAEALAPLLPFRQFITYALRQKENGKTDKLPTDYKTGRVADAHDPAVWTDYDTAYSKGDGKVGFVFTDKDPFWFLDIDDCLLPDGQWSPLAVELIADLPGAAVEVSLSGKGLHLFGTGTMPKHKTRSAVQPGLELYHTLRFAALGSGWSGGNASTDCSAGLIKVVGKYFARLPGEQEETPDWSSAPCVGWNGPLEDDDLIRRMRNSKSAAGVFGSRATADQLWMADVTALGAAYPATDRPYDASAADAALAQHLAFWTGKDCERMKRIMMRSQLSRDKWDRDDYLRRTILQAVGKQVDILSDKPPAVPTMTTAPEDLVGQTIMFPQTQKAVFDGCCYVADINKIIVPGGHCYNKEQFDAMNGGWLFVINPDNTKSISSAWECFTRSQAVRFPRVHSSAFKPHMRPGEIWTEGGDNYVNSYWPVVTPRVAGNPGPFLAHLAAMLPDQRDQEIILAYMAAIVQHKGIKFQWCPLIQGTRGNGKTLLSRCIIEAIGRKHCHSPAAAEITDKFNDWIENKVFIAVEDIYVPKERKEVVEILKPMITSDWQEIQGKGTAKRSRHVCANFMLNSNHKDAIRTSRDNRGLAVFYCAQQTVDDLVNQGMGGQYFPNLYNWLKREGYAIVHDYLAAYAIPDALNPAGACHRAPFTSTTEEVLRNSKGSIEQEIEAAVLEDRIGFRGGWVSGNYLGLLIKDLGAFHRVARNKRTEILRDAGYIPHPGLRSGQASIAVQPDGNKPVLYIKETSPQVGLKGIEATKAYSQAQLEPSHHLKLAV